MKYWLLTTEYPPFFGGGISTYCYHTASMLSQKGHAVTVFVNDKSVKTFQIEKFTEARVIRFNPDQTNSSSFLGNVTQLSFEFANIVKLFIEKEGQPDCIEAQDYQGIGYFLCQYKYCLYDWCKNIPIVITMHSPSFLYMEFNELPLFKKPNFWIGEMERFTIQAADLLISPSKFLVDELNKRFTITNANVHVIPNPYKFERSNDSYSDETIMNNELTFYGKLSAQKGTFKILELFKEIWDAGFDKSFTMVGDQNIVFPPLGQTTGVIVKREYAKYIKSGLLKFKSKISPSELKNYFSNSSIFIIPSTVDNLPYTVLELMGQGKLVIVSKQGGQSEVISNGSDGFVFDYSEIGSFNSTLIKAIGLSKEQRVSISKNAVNKIENNYSYDSIYSKKFQRLEELLNIGSLEKEIFPFVTAHNSKLDINPIGREKFGDRLSVIIPYFNLGAYIDEAIESVLNSSYPNLDILLINDGSTNQFDIDRLNKYRNHEKVKVVDKPNSGLADTRNFGASIANSKYLAFLDADDVVERTYYEKAITILSQYNNVHFVGAWTQYFGKSKSKWPTFNPEPPLILTHNTINSSALVYKKESFMKAGLNDLNFKIGLEDYESVISMIEKKLYGVAIPEFLFNYRVRNRSMIKNVTPEVRSNYYNKILEKHSELFSIFENEVNELTKNNGTPLSMDNSTLDDFPFQNIPVLKSIYPKLFRFVKSNPRVKAIVLKIRGFKSI